MNTILSNILSEDLVSAKSLIENRLNGFVSEYMDAKKVQIVAEKFNNGTVDYKKFLAPRLTKTQLKETLENLNEDAGHKYNELANQHGFDVSLRSGKHHEYTNYLGHELHVNHGTHEWKHYDVPGYEVAKGSGHESLVHHLSTANLDSTASESPDRHAMHSYEPAEHSRVHEGYVVPEKEHPYRKIAQEFGFKQKGPGQVRAGITTTSFDHPATNATLKLYQHHDVDKYSFLHSFGANRLSGSGSIQLRNRLKTLHNSETPDNPERYQTESHKVKISKPYPTCDVCKQGPAEYDGKTKQGPWAYMCKTCHDTHGVGTGTGKGQYLERE